MANLLSGVGALQQLEQVNATTPTQQVKQATKNQAVAPQDTVNLSQAGRVAGQAQASSQALASGDRGHDGDNH